MDSNGELIYHPRHALVNSGIIEKPPETLAEYQDGSYETEIGKQQVFCSVKTVGYTGWKIIRVIGKEELRSYGIKSTFFCAGGHLSGSSDFSRLSDRIFQWC